MFQELTKLRQAYSLRTRFVFFKEDLTCDSCLIFYKQISLPHFIYSQNVKKTINETFQVVHEHFQNKKHTSRVNYVDVITHFWIFFFIMHYNFNVFHSVDLHNYCSLQEDEPFSFCIQLEPCSEIEQREALANTAWYL